MYLIILYELSVAVLDIQKLNWILKIKLFCNRIEFLWIDKKENTSALKIKNFMLIEINNT